jgi:hypothetical protein
MGFQNHAQQFGNESAVRPVVHAAHHATADEPIAVAVGDQDYPITVFIVIYYTVSQDITVHPRCKIAYYLV